MYILTCNTYIDTAALHKTLLTQNTPDSLLNHYMECPIKSNLYISLTIIRIYSYIFQWPTNFIHHVNHLCQGASLYFPVATLPIN